MTKYKNIVILYQSQFRKGSKTNILHTDNLWTYTTIEVGLTGYKGQGQTKVKIQNIL